MKLKSCHHELNNFRDMPIYWMEREDIEMIQTERLNIYPLSDQEMRDMIHNESNEALKAAYAKMLAGCLKNPEQRIWLALWVLQLNDGSGKIVGSLSFKGLNDNGMVEIGYGNQLPTTIAPVDRSSALMPEVFVFHAGSFRALTQKPRMAGSGRPKAARSKERPCGWEPRLRRQGERLPGGLPVAFESRRPAARPGRAVESNAADKQHAPDEYDTGRSKQRRMKALGMGQQKSGDGGSRHLAGGVNSRQVTDRSAAVRWTHLACQCGRECRDSHKSRSKQQGAHDETGWTRPENRQRDTNGLQDHRNDQRFYKTPLLGEGGPDDTGWNGA